MREVLSVRERERERYRERERERERDGSDVTIFALKLAMNLHFPLPKVRTFRFSLHTERTLVMAAKEAIFELLKDCSLSKEDLTENILTCVRQHKLGTVPIARYAKEALKLDNLDSERFGSTVESHVRAMVDVVRSTDTHSRGSQNRGTVDDDVTVDLDSDNLDEDECIEERDSDIARGSAKARSLARAAIAEADHQEKGDNEAENDNQPVGDGEKPEDNASTEDVRPTSGDAYDEATVSAHSQTLDVLKQIMETLEREREESRNREDRLNRQIKDLSGKLQHLWGLGCFLGIKWVVTVPIFTLFNFFPLQTYFYAKSHLLSMLKSKKSDRCRRK